MRNTPLKAFIGIYQPMLTVKEKIQLMELEKNKLREIYDAGRLAVLANTGEIFDEYFKKNWNQ